MTPSITASRKQNSLLTKSTKPPSSYLVVLLICRCDPTEKRSLQDQYPNWLYYFIPHNPSSIGLRFSRKQSPRLFARGITKQKWHPLHVLWSRVTNYNCSLRSNSNKYSRPRLGCFGIRNSRNMPVAITPVRKQSSLLAITKHSRS
jgi:hypothetical protein